MDDRNGASRPNLQNRGKTHEFSYPNDSRIPPTSGLTPSQTIGPFFAYGLTPRAYGYPLHEIHTNDLAGPDVAGTRITLSGQVFDANGHAVHDAMVELIQADSNGRYVTQPRNDGFTGYGRTGTGAQGPEAGGGDTRFIFRTVKPGATVRGHAPVLTLVVAMRGLLNHCITRVYFPEDAWQEDPVMTCVPENRRRTLLAEEVGPHHYRFDIRMQGPDETVFFDI